MTREIFSQIYLAISFIGQFIYPERGKGMGKGGMVVIVASYTVHFIRKYEILVYDPSNDK